MTRKGDNAYHFTDRMLFDFHKHENQKKPHSVTAAYLITGVLDNTPSRKDLDDDEVMQSSPFVSSQITPDDDEASSSEEAIPVTTVLLVREDELNGRILSPEFWLA